jgi:hypothetical protein
MPRKIDPLRDQIKRLEAVVKADKTERRAAEAPLRTARKSLTERLLLLKYNLTKAQANRASMLAPFWITDEAGASFAYGQRWRDNHARIEQLTKDIASAEIDLALFNTQHPELI